MAFVFTKGRTRLRSLPKTTSTTITAGDLLIMTSGLLATALNNTTTTVVGVAVKAVASTDGDYATAAARLLVEVPADTTCVLSAPVANGSLLTTSIGVKFGLTSAGAVDFADNTDIVVTCVDFISASEGLFALDETAMWLS